MSHSDQRLIDFIHGRIPREAPDYKELQRLVIKQRCINPAKGREPSQDDTTCSICIANVDTQNCAARLGCNHSFHAQCIDEWICRRMSAGEEPICPMCRSAIF